MKNINKKLKENGYRATTQRKHIFDTLLPFPQSISEISSSLKNKGTNIDIVTIYRTLDCFIKLGIVGKTQFKDKISKYEIISNDYHHHHLVCDRCGSIEDIPLDDNFLINKISKQTNFKIKSHSLEFFGICGKCQSL
jgi:Fe2+/Zn2+ uptake regulation proteins